MSKASREPTDVIACSAPAVLLAQLADMQLVFGQPESEHNWERFAKALARLAALTRGGAYKLEPFAMVVGPSITGGVGDSILACILSERAALSKAAVDLLSAFAPRLGPAFTASLQRLYLPALIDLIRRTNNVVRLRAEACLSLLLETVPHPAALGRLLAPSVADANVHLRRAVGRAFGSLVGAWARDGPRADEVEAVVRRLAGDKDPEARKLAKELWEAYCHTWPERVDGFMGPLTPVTRKRLGPRPAITAGSGSASSSLLAAGATGGGAGRPTHNENSGSSSSSGRQHVLMRAQVPGPARVGSGLRAAYHLQQAGEPSVATGSSGGSSSSRRTACAPSSGGPASSSSPSSTTSLATSSSGAGSTTHSSAYPFPSSSSAAYVYPASSSALSSATRQTGSAATLQTLAATAPRRPVLGPPMTSAPVLATNGGSSSGGSRLGSSSRLTTTTAPAAGLSRQPIHAHSSASLLSSSSLAPINPIPPAFSRSATMAAANSGLTTSRPPRPPIGSHVRSTSSSSLALGASSSSSISAMGPPARVAPRSISASASSSSANAFASGPTGGVGSGPSAAATLAFGRGLMSAPVRGGAGGGGGGHTLATSSTSGAGGWMPRSRGAAAGPAATTTVSGSTVSTSGSRTSTYPVPSGPGPASAATTTPCAPTLGPVDDVFLSLPAVVIAHGRADGAPPASAAAAAAAGSLSTVTEATTSTAVDDDEPANVPLPATPVRSSPSPPLSNGEAPPTPMMADAFPPAGSSPPAIPAAPTPNAAVVVAVGDLIDFGGPTPDAELGSSDATLPTTSSSSPPPPPPAAGSVIGSGLADNLFAQPISKADDGVVQTLSPPPGSPRARERTTTTTPTAAVEIVFPPTERPRLAPSVAVADGISSCSTGLVGPSPTELSAGPPSPAAFSEPRASCSPARPTTVPLPPSPSPPAAAPTHAREARAMAPARQPSSAPPPVRPRSGHRSATGAPPIGRRPLPPPSASSSSAPPSSTAGQPPRKERVKLKPPLPSFRPVSRKLAQQPASAAAVGATPRVFGGELDVNAAGTVAARGGGGRPTGTTTAGKVSLVGKGVKAGPPSTMSVRPATATGTAAAVAR